MQNPRPSNIIFGIIIAIITLFVSFGIGALLYHFNNSSTNEQDLGRLEQVNIHL